MRILSLGGIDKISNHLVANPIIHGEKIKKKLVTLIIDAVYNTYIVDYRLKYLFDIFIGKFYLFSRKASEDEMKYIFKMIT